MKRPKGAAGREGPLHAALPACTGKAAELPHAAGPWFSRRVLSRERSRSPGSASSTQSSECCAEVPEHVSVSPSVLCAPLVVRSCVGFLTSTGDSQTSLCLCHLALLSARRSPHSSCCRAASLSGMPSVLPHPSHLPALPRVSFTARQLLQGSGVL